MKLYFVRHGKTQYNEDGRTTGWVEVPLTTEGAEQARETANSISNNFTKIYSSDLLRCKQTAEIINQKLNVPIIYDARLRERNFGSLEGSFIAELDTTLRKKDKNQQYDYRPYGGESVEDVSARLLEFINDIKNKEKNEKILVVTSGGIIRLLHSKINNTIHEKILNSSVHEFDFKNTYLK